MLCHKYSLCNIPLGVMATLTKNSIQKDAITTGKCLLIL